MAEFQWWLLIVGLVAGGGLVAVILMDGSRNAADVTAEERRAEANWISRWLAGEGRSVSPSDVETILEAHQTYLSLPPPDSLTPAGGEASAPAPAAPPESADGDADRAADEVGHDRRGGADQDLASA